ncbi:MAG: efflux RND transporter periplasmic adaptor subunit [Gammaproteobacteria bacterium]|nr:efflux RND transporter periplasmic adaptor subunit [Gammaproteobacteria bacterium]
MKTDKPILSIVLVATLLFSGIEAAEPSVEEGGNNSIPELDCIIEPSEIVDVGSAVPGVVESIQADRNDQVSKGTIIARLESSVERATFELSRERASLNTAIELRQEGARFGHLTQKRSNSLLQTAAISKHEMDSVLSETRIAELQVRQERDNKRIAGLELLRAEAVLDRRTIRSPVHGVVLERFKAAGEYVDDEPVLRIAQLDPLHVEIIVSTDYLGRIAPGMQAEVTPAVPEANTYLARVERVDRVSDAASGTYGVRLSLANPDYNIPAGLRCRLGFVASDQAEIAKVLQRPKVPALPALSEVVTVARENVELDTPADKAPEQAVASAEKIVAVDRVAVSLAAIAPASEPEQVNEQQVSGSCHTIGPFAREKIARRWFDGLQERSENLELRNEKLTVNRDFIVLASIQRDPNSRQSLIKGLDRAGITDRYVFSSGARKGQVSLGVYRRHRSALKRQKLLAAKGFPSEIIPRSKKIKHFWLDLSLPVGKDLPTWISQLPSNSSVKSVICSAQFAQR